MPVTQGQQDVANYLQTVKGRSASDYIPTGGDPEAMIMADPRLQGQMGEDGTYSGYGQKIIAENRALMGQNNGQQTLASNYQNADAAATQKSLDFWKAHPTGTDDDFMDKFMSTAFPAIVGGFMTGGLATAMGGAAAGGAAGAAGAVGDAAAGAGGAAAAAGDAAAVGSGALSNLSPYLTKGLTSMGVKAATNLATGQNLTSGLLSAGLMSGAGAFAGNYTNGFIGDGLKSLGFEPDTIKSLTTPITTSALSTGTGLLRGQSLGTALKGGAQSGAISYGGQALNDYLKTTDLSKPMTDVLGSAGKGAIGSVVKGQNPLTGVISGAASGALGVGTGMASSAIKDATAGNAPQPNSENNMSDTSNEDWLSGLYTNLDNPYDFKTAPTDFTNYGLPDNTDPTTVDNAGDTPDYLSSIQPDYSGDNQVDPSANADLAKWLAIQNQSAVGNPGGSGDAPANGGSAKPPSGFLDNLLKQLSGAGTKASANPLATIAALIGGAGTIRNAVNGGPPSDVGKVTALMQQGSQQMNAAPAPARGQITARDPRFFTQQYGANGVPVAPAPAVGALSQFGGQ